MKARRIALGLVGALVVAGAVGWFSLDKEARGLLATLPTNRDVLFWSQPQRDAAFRALDRLPVLAKARDVPAGGTPMPLPSGPPLQLPLDVDAYMAGQRSAALLIVHDGKLRLERYGLGFDNSGRWTTFSVAKSITSTLVGAAIKDGYIRSMDDKVSDYIPEMKGSAYDDVSLRQLLTMTSGVKWNEDYADPNSDVAKFNNHKPEEGVDALVSYMRKLPREAPAGTRWLYSTGETNLVGVLLGRATKKPLATYLSEKIWVPAGMEQQATWILNRSGKEISGCCIQAAPRDFARFGLVVVEARDVRVRVGVVLVPAHARGHRQQLSDADVVVGRALHLRDVGADLVVHALDVAVADRRADERRRDRLGDRERRPAPGAVEAEAVTLEAKLAVVHDEQGGTALAGHVVVDVEPQLQWRAGRQRRRRRAGRHDARPGQHRQAVEGAERSVALRLAPEQDIAVGRQRGQESARLGVQAGPPRRACDDERGQHAQHDVPRLHRGTPGTN